jgi:hypothetical protein
MSPCQLRTAQQPDRMRLPNACRCSSRLLARACRCIKACPGGGAASASARECWMVRPRPHTAHWWSMQVIAWIEFALSTQASYQVKSEFKALLVENRGMTFPSTHCVASTAGYQECLRWGWAAAAAVGGRGHQTDANRLHSLVPCLRPPRMHPNNQLPLHAPGSPHALPPPTAAPRLPGLPPPTHSGGPACPGCPLPLALQAPEQPTGAGPGRHHGARCAARGRQARRVHQGRGALRVLRQLLCRPGL